MTFGVALELAKQGYRITRKGWNGRGMFVYYQEGSEVETDNLRCKAIRNWMESKGFSAISIQGHLDMKNAQDEIIVGWLAAQPDLLSDDWEVFE